MPYIRKNLLILPIIILFLFIIFNFAYARKLDIPIPGLTTLQPKLPEYIVGLFKFTITAFGIICFVAFVYGAIRYLASAGSPPAITDAKDQIFSALLGLLLIFSSWLILNTINPELVVLVDPGAMLPGAMPVGIETPVIAYKNADFKGDACAITRSADNINDLCGSGWDDTISSIKVGPSYIVILHEHPNRGTGVGAWFTLGIFGTALVVERNMPRVDAFINDKTTSVTLIRKGTGGQQSATFWGDQDYKATDDKFSIDFKISSPNFSEVKYDDPPVTMDNKTTSISMTPNTIVVVYDLPNYKGDARIFTSDTKDLCCVWGPAGGPLFSPCGVYCWNGRNWNDYISSAQILNGHIIFYNKYIDIAGATGAGNDYQVKITLTKATDLTDSAGVGKCRDDFNDVMFFDLKGTPLNFFRESYVSGVSADFWVKINDSLEGTTTQTIIVEYGDQNLAESWSNIENTFIFGDDFEGNSSLPKWVVAPIGTCQTSTDKHPGGINDPRGVKGLKCSIGQSNIEKTFSTPLTNAAVHVNYFNQNAATIEAHTLSVLGPSGAMILSDDDISLGNYAYRIDPPVLPRIVTVTGKSRVANQWRVFEIRSTTSSGTPKKDFIINTVPLSLVAPEAITIAEDGITKIALGSFWGANATPSYFDSVFIRKFVDPEPTVVGVPYFPPP